MSKQDDERFWNLMIYKVYATNEEMGQMGPFMAIVVIVLLAGIWIVSLFVEQKPQIMTKTETKIVLPAEKE